MNLLIPTSLLWSCGPDVSITPEANEPPQASIQSPTSDTIFGDGQILELVGAVGDPNGLDDLATVLWNSSVDGELGNSTLSAPDSDGRTQVDVVLTPGTHAITLSVTDQAGLEAQDSITVTITGDGVMTTEIVSPEPFSEFLSGSTVAFEGIVSAAHVEVDTLGVKWRIEPNEGGESLVFATGSPSSTGSVSADWSSEPGNWLVTLVAEDEWENTSEDEVYIVVADVNELDQDGDGVSPGEGDCDDYDASVFEGNVETCGDGKDNDCSGVLDDKDVDADGHIDEDCTDYTGSDPVDDCDDDDPAVNPSASDAPDMLYVDEDCDGIDGATAGGVVFLDPFGGDDGQNGLSETQAVKTLDTANSRALSAGAGWILVADGNVELNGAFAQGVSVAGGYDADDGWARYGDILPSVSVPASGTRLSGWSDSTEWQQLELSADNGNGAGGSSFAVVMENSSGLYLNAVTVSSGNGQDGQNGSDGSDASNASDGSDGSDGCEDSTGFCDSCSQPSKGSGGSGCSSGGDGGNTAKGGSSGSTGSSGGGGASGGSGGSSTSNGGSGTAGSDGSDGSDGTGGSSLGSFSSGGYAVSSGTDGSSGSSGAGGGGGGGGGGGTSWCDSYGGAGGGGGGGACAGGGGDKGTGGGTSVAILLVNSSITIDSSTIATGSGGDGGDGGDAGSGGGGGDAGDGGSGEDDSGSGGNGGAGGDGGDGGAGGGGGGGPSVGIVCTSSSSISLDSDTTFDIGDAGGGGNSDGDDGDDGEQADTDGC
ncbi:MAG TPA: putative metal-binding motif-containing protein [Myxococcota bacterium]|nr:putative metal-binding motif-containing protein [Myxococcota bacterium]